MNRKISIIVLLFSLFLLSGCYALEIEDYSIVAGIGIDYTNNEFEVTYELYEEKNGQTTNISSTTKSAKGTTISQATNNIVSLMNKKPYLNHTSVILLSEEAVKYKFNEIINHLMHDVRIRSACYLIITKNQTAKKIFEKSQENKKVIAYDIFKHFDTKEGQVQKWSKTKFNEILNERINVNGTIILPMVIYEDDCNINGAYLINSDNEQTIVNDYEVFAIQIFNDEITEGLFDVKNMESYYIKQINQNIKYNNYEIYLEVNLQIQTYEQINIEDEQIYIDKIVKELEDYLEEVYYKYTLMNFDPFRIYNLLQKYYPNEYDKNKDNYKLFLINSMLKTKITIELLSLGLSEERI